MKFIINQVTNADRKLPEAKSDRSAWLQATNRSELHADLLANQPTNQTTDQNPIAWKRQKVPDLNSDDY